MKNIRDFDYDELGLRKATLNLVRNIKPEELVVYAFNDALTNIRGIGRDRQKEIFTALIAAGYLPERYWYCRDEQVNFLCEVLGLTQEELCRKYGIISRDNPSRQIFNFFESLLGLQRCTYKMCEFYSESRKQELVNILDSQLRSCESLVLQGRLGLKGWKNTTLEEISRETGWTREQVKQIEAKARRKMCRQDGVRLLKKWFFTDDLLKVVESEINWLVKINETESYEYQWLVEFRMQILSVKNS